MKRLLVLLLVAASSLAEQQPSDDVTGSRRNQADPCDRYDVNGCSIPLDLPFFFKKEFTSSCNRHDICYRCAVDYSVSRNECDTAFLYDLRAACRENFSPNPHHEAPRSLKELLTSMDSDDTVVNSKISGADYSFDDKPFSGINPLNSDADDVASVGSQSGDFLELWFRTVTVLVDEWETAEKISHLLESQNISPGFRVEDRDAKLMADFKKLLQSRNDSVGDQSYNARANNSPKSDTLRSLINDFQENPGSEEKPSSERSLEICYDFANLYFRIVDLFGNSSYRATPPRFCDEDFVKGCLPVIM